MSNIKKILPSLVDSGNFTSDLVPDGSGTRDLGSSAKPWKDLYVTSGTINIGGETISVDDDGISFSKPIKVRDGGLTRRLRATNSDFITTGDTGNFADVTSLESFPQGLNVGTSNNLASKKLHVVGDIEISGTIFQSGSVFEGGGGGGGSSICCSSLNSASTMAFASALFFSGISTITSSARTAWIAAERISQGA